MAVERPADAFQARWLAYAPAWFTTDADPDAPPVVIQLVASGEQAVMEVGGALFVYCWSDAGDGPGPYGLVRADGTPKPALAALTTAAAAL
jgi:hypothetical protein